MLWVDPQITNFSLEPNNSTSIDISFEIETNGQLTLLSLKYSCCQDDKKSVNLLREEMKTNRTLKKHIVLNKLEEGTKYEIELSAANREGFSSKKNTTMTVEDSKFRFQTLQVHVQYMDCADCCCTL